MIKVSSLLSEQSAGVAGCWVWVPAERGAAEGEGSPLLGHGGHRGVAGHGGQPRDAPVVLVRHQPLHACSSRYIASTVVIISTKYLPLHT